MTELKEIERLPTDLLTDKLKEVYEKYPDIAEDYGASTSEGWANLSAHYTRYTGPSTRDAHIKRLSEIRPKTEFVASNIPTERYEYTAIEQNGAIVGFRVNCIVQDDFKLEIKND
jgi:hypothetical protein